MAPTIRATTNPEEALKDASFIIHAVPVQYSRKFLEDIAPHVPKNTPIISTSKVRALIVSHLNAPFSWDFALLRVLCEEMVSISRDYPFIYLFIVCKNLQSTLPRSPSESIARLWEKRIKTPCSAMGLHR